MPPGAPPGVVAVTITGSVRYEPFTPEMLNEPGVREAIVACERGGGTGCRERSIPGEPRARFVQAEDERVYVFIEMRALESDRAYELSVRWFGPDGGVTARMSKTLATPSNLHPDFTYAASFWASVPRMLVGRWRVEVSVNGRVETERTFEIAGKARAQGAPPAA